MEKIGSYNVYQNNLYEGAAQAGRSAANARASQAKSTNAAKENKTPELSKAAQNLLKELQKTYGNMDVMVADYETDEEAASYLSRGTSEYGVVFTSDELEKMAADENVKKQNLSTLDDAVSKLGEIKKELGEKGEEVSRLGISIGNDGEVSFFAELEKSSEKQRERIDKQREDKREAAKEAEKAAKADEMGRYMPGRPSGKRTTVFASSVDELKEKIDQVDWSKVKEESFNPYPAGQRFNLSI